MNYIYLRLKGFPSELLQNTLCKLCKNAGFLSTLFCRIRAESQILSSYRKIHVREDTHSAKFHAVIICKKQQQPATAVLQNISYKIYLRYFPVNFSKCSEQIFVDNLQMTASTKRLKCNGSSIRILIENMDNQNCRNSENGQKLVPFYVYCRRIKESLFLKRMIQHFFFNITITL